MAAISSITQMSSVASSPSGSSQVGAKVVSAQVKPQQSHVGLAQSKKQEQPATEQPVTEKQVQQAVSQATLDFAGKNESVGFSYEKKLGQLFVQIKDSQSGEVIREIPSKEFIQHRIAMREMIGLILDRQG